MREAFAEQVEGSAAVLQRGVEDLEGDAVQQLRLLLGDVTGAGLDDFRQLFGLLPIPTGRMRFSRTAISTNHNVSIQGGLKNMPYRVSLGFEDNNGIVKTTPSRVWYMPPEFTSLPFATAAAHALHVLRRQVL